MGSRGAIRRHGRGLAMTASERGCPARKHPGRGAGSPSCPRLCVSGLRKAKQRPVCSRESAGLRFLLSKGAS